MIGCRSCCWWRQWRLRLCWWCGANADGGRTGVCVIKYYWPASVQLRLYKNIRNIKNVDAQSHDNNDDKQVF